MGIANIINTSTSSGGGGGEIIRELINSSDGAGVFFSNTGYIHLANNAAAEFGTSDFSIEFILNQTGEVGTSGGSIYQSATTVNNKFSIENHVSSNVVKLIFFNAVGAAAQYDLPYNMAADYNEPTHYVVSCDRSGNAVLYRNGTEVASVSIAVSASTNLGDGVTSTAMIGNSGSGYTFLGGLYRFRTWNKALTHDEVDTCFQRADVPFESQYGSQTSLVDANASTFVGTSTYGWVKYGNNGLTNTSNQLVVTYVDHTGGAYNRLKDASDLTSDLTVGKKYRVQIDAKYAGGSASAYLQVYDGENYIDASVLTTSLTTYYIEFTAQHATNAFVKINNLGAGNVVTLDNYYVYSCGVLTDHDLAFANPTQSAMCQDRANKSDGTMGGTIQQTQPIVQLNSTSARIGTSAKTVSDGDLAASGDIYVGNNGKFYCVNNAGVNSLLISNYESASRSPYFSADPQNQGSNTTMRFHVDGSEKMQIDSSGRLTINGTSSTDIGTLSNATSLYLENSTANKPVGITFGASNAGGGPSGTGTSSARISAICAGAVGEFESDLVFETRNVGSTISEKMRIDTAGNVLVNGGGYLRVGPSNSTAQIQLYRNDSSIADGNAVGDIKFGGADAGNDTAARIRCAADGADWTATSSPTRLEFGTTPSGSETVATRMTIDSVGETTISRITAGGGTGANTILTLQVSDLPVGTDMQAGDGTRLLFKVPAADTSKVGASIDAIRAQATDADSSTDLRFMVSQNDETLDTAMTINSAGSILVGTTAAAVSSGRIMSYFDGTTGNGLQIHDTTTGTTTDNAVVFTRNTSTVGKITTTNSSTAYVTSSDYRLKENLEPLTGALDRIEQLPVYRFNFKADPETTVDGFVAHEVSEFVPEAISGTKDGMQTVVVKEAVEAKPATYWEEDDELPEGVEVGDEKTPAIEAQEEVTEEQPDYQGIDQSKLVPLLVAAVKELKAKVEALENA